MTNTSFSCIIPFHDEGKNVLQVVEIISHVNEINQIICVDDGSNDNISLNLAREFPLLKLIKLQPCHGKCRAIFEGLKHVINDNLFLIDADLKNLQIDELRQAIKQYFINEIDMLILQVKGDNELIDRILRHDIFQSGTRLLKTKDLRTIAESSSHGYQLEVAINKYMMEHGRKVCWVKNSARNPHKVKKLGFLKGLFADTKMQFEIIAYAGIINYLKQMIFFARGEIKQ